mgnify:CR=1 FL=1
MRGFKRIVSLLIVICTYLMIWKGMKYLGKIFTKLIPIMSISYLVFGLVIIFINYKNIPQSFMLIFKGAFTGTAAVGGFAGAAVSKIIQTGMARSVYSNEAGWGTSPMIHSSADTPHPIEQGLWGSFEVFFDTFIVCSITALSVILSGTWTDGATGGALALSAFNQSFGTVGSILLAIIMVIFTLTAGSAVLMWIGERITEKGVGNGISIVLTINIISRMPDDIKTLYDQFISGKNVPKAILAAVIILAIIVGMVLFVVYLQGGERRIPVQYSKKIQGRKQVGGQSTYIPLKVNTGGVIPVIFAQSLLQTPVIIASLLGKGNGTGIGSKILRGMSQSNWCNPSEPIYSIGLVVYIVLIIAFAYFYTSITFNPLEIANNMKKAGGFIPGIRPGKPTSDYLNRILNYIVFIGAVALAFIAFVPIFFNGVFGADVSFGGTSIIIIVGVVIETLKQIESQMRVRYYKGFLND